MDILGIPLQERPPSETHFRWEGEKDGWKLLAYKRFAPLSVDMPASPGCSVALSNSDVVIYAAGLSLNQAEADLRQKLALRNVNV
jgi:hypothetical protein